MRKTLSVVFAVLLMLGMLAGCGKTAAPSPAPVDTQPAAGEPTVNEFGWEIPEKTLDLTYYGGQDDPDASAKRTAVISKYLLEKFNIKADKIVYDNDVAERLSMMLAAGDYPQLITCMTPSQANDWKSLGKTVDMKPHIDQHAPEFVKRLGDIYKRYVDADGQMHMLPNGWGILEICDSAPQIRYDWWKEAGQPAANTPDDYFSALSQMVAAHPEDSQGNKVFALSFYKDRGVSGYINLFGAMWGLTKGYKEGADHSMTFFPGTEEGWALTQYVNRFQLAGLIDPDSFVQTIDDWRQKVAAQRVAGDVDSWWPTRCTADFWPDAIPGYDSNLHLFVHIDVKAPGVAASTFNPKDANGYYRTVVTDKCQDPEGIAKFINLENSSLAIKLFGLGVPMGYEGIPADEKDCPTWRLTDTPPYWAFDEAQKEKMLNNTFDYETASYMGPTEIWVTAYQGFAGEDGFVCWYDQNFNDEVWWKKYMNDNMKASMFDASAFLAIQYPADDPVTMKKQQITDVVESMWVQAVMSKSEAECKAVYDEMVAKCNTLGLADLNQYVTTQYQNLLNSWK